MGAYRLYWSPFEAIGTIVTIDTERIIWMRRGNSETVYIKSVWGGGGEGREGGKLELLQCQLNMLF